MHCNTAFPFLPSLFQLLFGLSAMELDLFDGFEDDEYERVEVVVTLLSDSADGSSAQVR